ncbi:MAG: polysaccharide deacetylase family protein [Treponema sp.]|jgi:peptidoglycan/xylan/chitin deacetylase (PgdA/CDA1 family)|nr:polysaccharide deacetylase family protein [Treponema sp.]
MKAINDKIGQGAGMRIWWYLLFFMVWLPISEVMAQVGFSGLDVSDDNRLLFRADSKSGGASRQGALFISRLTDLVLEQITAFPENLDLIEQGKTLQVRNMFGTTRIPVSGGLPRAIPGIPGFTQGTPVLGGRVGDIATSEDGKWILLMEPLTAAYGNLVLLEVASGAKTTIARTIERPDTAFPAGWSPDSQVFVYVRGGKLYYYPVSGASAGVTDERYRLIGEGAINSVQWGKTGDFFYLQGSTVYRVRGAELFTRTVYTDFLELSTVVGTIPFTFDPNGDTFMIAPDSRSLVFSQGRRNVFFYPLRFDDYNLDYGAALPYLMMPLSCFDLRVLWSPNGVITVIASVFKKDGAGIMVYRLNTGVGREHGFVPLVSPEGSRVALSPDGTKVLFWGEQGIVLYDYLTWNVLQTISSFPAFSCLWMGNNEFIIGDTVRIERIQIAKQRDASNARNLICLASAEEFGFEEKTGRILAKSGGTWFVSNRVLPWVAIREPRVRAPSLGSGRYQVYLEAQDSGPYENLPMIRNITLPVPMPPLVPKGEYLKLGESSGIRITTGSTSGGAGALITNGPRTGPLEVALCFDLYDDTTGLFEVLDVLKRFKVKATFFLNGEFIRRHPLAAITIADAGHETASMFFLPINISETHYQGDFIARGLARNKEEFYRATGSELSLLWHPPYYALSPEIISAAAEAGYKTLGRDVDPMDWVSREDTKQIGISQYSASEMVDRIMIGKQPGSIIPIRLGLLPGGRNDYLFSRINVLLDALSHSGYSVVPVSRIIGK